MFEVENKYYQENRDILREKYLGKRLVIVNDQILGVYDTNTEAIKETSMELVSCVIKNFTKLLDKDVLVLFVLLRL